VILVARETRDLRRHGVADSSNSDKVTLLGTAPAFRSAVELAPARRGDRRVRDDHR
jgi:hypothetical protein